MDLPVDKILENGMHLELDYMHSHEQETVRTLLNLIIVEGKSYPQKQPLTELEFRAYWLNQAAFVVRHKVADNTAKPKEILGAFFLKPNFPGRCSHIGNAGFIVQREMRGLGLGRFMGEAMLEIAFELGYKAVMFNLVFANNIPSLRLWESLGFEIIGQIPAAVELNDRTFIDAVIMYRCLEEKGKGKNKI
ncbi:GNAT family N-acetyltransferase [Calothrix sp. UHCC 0171]|uniref:GNAT family N-acetyltransferase n=1 Tax=Calothrix sp. UHCC 0171 TaxID=3110245 RepID=UPI002B204602|nr:GNAT family N-acetyltransferase [Calothrix sp. UHCC 0171]MEA5570294.1 GNAT family N-acetyltransferase [Calothrix sp. UHCC 0171]